MLEKPVPESITDLTYELRLETRAFGDGKTLVIPLVTDNVEAELERMGWTIKEDEGGFAGRHWMSSAHIPARAVDDTSSTGSSEDEDLSDLWGVQMDIVEVEDVGTVTTAEA